VPVSLSFTGPEVWAGSRKEEPPRKEGLSVRYGKGTRDPRVPDLGHCQQDHQRIRLYITLSGRLRMVKERCKEGMQELLALLPNNPR